MQLKRLLKIRVIALLFACASFSPARAQSDAGAKGVFEGHSDVGATLHTGAVEYDAASGGYTVSGGGENIWSTNDAFHFVWKKVSGDATLAADISFLGTGGAPHRKACLMFRQSHGADSVYADAAVHGAGLTSLQYRPGKGEITKQIQSKATGPKRVRIEKRGNIVTMSISNSEGKLEPLEGSIEITLKDPFYVGLAVCAHDNKALEKAVFSKVEMK